MRSAGMQNSGVRVLQWVCWDQKWCVPHTRQGWCWSRGYR